MTISIQDALLIKFNGDTAAIKRAVKNQRRVGKWYRAPVTPHTRYLCKDGPWAGEYLDLSSPSTGVLAFGDHRGQYIKWTDPRFASWRQEPALTWRAL